MCTLHSAESVPSPPTLTKSCLARNPAVQHAHRDPSAAAHGEAQSTAVSCCSPPPSVQVCCPLSTMPPTLYHAVHPLPCHPPSTMPPTLYHATHPLPCHPPSTMPPTLYHATCPHTLVLYVLGPHCYTTHPCSREREASQGKCKHDIFYVQPGCHPPVSPSLCHNKHTHNKPPCLIHALHLASGSQHGRYHCAGAGTPSNAAPPGGHVQVVCAEHDRGVHMAFRVGEGEGEDGNSNTMQRECGM